MIFGIRRATATLAFSLLVGGVLVTAARAELDPFHNSFEREVAAMDTSTGEPIMAPPVPYGHYAKDPLGHMATKGSMLHAKFSGMGHGATAGLGHGHGLGLGKGCKNCGDGGHGLGHGAGFGHGDSACGTCGGSGLFSGKKCGGCGGNGFLGHGGGLGLGHGHKVHGVAPIPAGFASTGIHGSGQSASSQGVAVSQCGEPGCGLFKGHSKGCNSCGGSGLFQGRGCGSCGGRGLLSHGNGCGTPGCGDGNCGGGHGLGHGYGKGCSACGGKGCGLCAGLKSKLGGLAHPKAALGNLLHPGGPKIKYFVGPGGPVPITPGYVPYVVTTRSPRDFFAFPPFTQ